MTKTDRVTTRRRTSADTLRAAEEVGAAACRSGTSCIAPNHMRPAEREAWRLGWNLEFAKTHGLRAQRLAGEGR